MQLTLATALASLGCGALAACGSDSPTIDHVYDSYGGPPVYPDTRPKITLPDGDFALVPSSGGDTLAVIDLTKGTTVGASPLGRDPVSIDGPHQIVADRKRGVAYAVLSYPGSAANAGQHSHGSSSMPGWVQAVALDDLRPVGEMRVDPNPGEIAVSDDGHRLVVTHFDLTTASVPGTPIDVRRSTVAVVDPTTILPFGTPQPDKLLTCIAPHGVALSRPDGAKAFVACYGEDVVAIVDLANTHAPVVRVPVASTVVPDPPVGAPSFGPYAVALAPSGQRIAVSNRDAKELRFLDVASAKMESLVTSLLGAPYFAAWSADGAQVYVPTRGLDALVVVDAASGMSTRTKVFDSATCQAPLEAIVPATPGIVYVVCEGNVGVPGAVLTLDAVTLDVEARVAVGMFPGRSFVGRGR